MSGRLMVGLLLGGVVLVTCCSCGPRQELLLHERKVGLLVAKNFLTGKEWPLGLPSSQDAPRLLQAKYSFKRGNDAYSLAGLCKEITRATGKRVVWLRAQPDGWSATTLSIPPPESIGRNAGRAPRPGMRCRLELGAVLEYLVSQTTDGVFYDDLLPSEPWTAWVGDEAIFIIPLPKRDASTQQPTAGQTASDSRAERMEQGPCFAELRLVQIVLPTDWCLPPGLDPAQEMAERARWMPAVPAVEQQRAALGDMIHLQAGEYTVRGFAEAVAKASGKAVRWIPDAHEASGGGRRLVDAPLFQVGPAKRFARERGVRLDAHVELGKALGCLLAVATEIGFGRESPDHEVWTALLGDDQILLIMLPGWSP